MNEEKTHNSIHDNVLKAIEAGQVKMKPKWHFVVRTALLIVGTILLSLSLLYLASFIMFITRQNGLWFVSGYGRHGLNVLLSTIPWLLVLLVALFIVLLQILIKKYSFGYGKPLMFSAIAIIGLVLVGGFLVERTRIHQGLFRQAEDDQLPIFGAMYREFGEEHSDSITIGIIHELLDNGYRIENPSSNNIVIIVTPQTKLPPSSSLNIGDIIFVLGYQQGNVVKAEGIRLFDGIMLPPPPRYKQMMHNY